VTIRIRYYATELAPQDLLMLSSDGLHGVVESAEIRDILASAGTSLSDKCSGLIAAAHEAGSPDNVTVVLIRSSGSKPST